MDNTSSSSSTNWVSTLFGYKTSLESKPSRNTTITTNKNITKLQDNASTYNTAVKSNTRSLNQKLQKINYSDNNIRKIARVASIGG